jgi:FkbM family methyltransferase
MLKAILGRAIPPRVTLRWQAQRNLRSGEPELSLVQDLCDGSHAAVDVGANIGVYAYVARKYAAHVYAVEANPRMAERLQRTLGKDEKVTVLPFALSDTDGEATLWLPYKGTVEVSTRSSLEADANPGFQTHAVGVQKKMLDDLRLHDVGFIKIDVEGHELAVLRGASKTLASCHPNLLIEIEERHHAGGTSRAFSYLRDLSYRGYFIHDGKLNSIEEFDPELHQRSENAKSVGGRRNSNYVNNFIFIHPTRSDASKRIAKRFPFGGS